MKKMLIIVAALQLTTACHGMESQKIVPKEFPLAQAVDAELSAIIKSANLETQRQAEINRVWDILCSIERSNIQFGHHSTDTQGMMRCFWNGVIALQIYKYRWTHKVIPHGASEKPWEIGENFRIVERKEYDSVGNFDSFIFDQKIKYELAQKLATGLKPALYHLVS